MHKIKPETKSKPQRVVIYTRISSDAEGEGEGVERQEKDCLKRVEREDGWRVVKIFTENDVGASSKSKKKRPLYAQMIAMVERGEVDVILAYSNSRLTRRLREFADLLDLHERTGVLIKTIVSGDDDLDTADGQMVATIKAGVDVAEANRISERVRRSVKERVAAGKWLGGPRPFGWQATYEKQANGKPKKVYNELDDLEAKMVAAAIKHVIEGGTVSEILRLWTFCELETASGGKVWRHVGVNRILTRPRNAGILEYREVIQTDTEVPWKPICTADDLAKVRAVILDPSRSKGPGGTPKHLLSGIPVCGKCGSALKSGAVRSRGKTYRMYRCHGDKCGLAMKIEHLDGVVVKAVLKAYRQTGTDRLAKAKSEGQELVTSAHKELAGVLAERREVEEAINEGLTSIAAMRPTLRRINEAEEGLRADIARLYREDAHAAMVASAAQMFKKDHKVSITEAAQGMRERWDAMPLDQRRKLIRALFTVTVHPGRGTDRVEVVELFASLRPMPSRRFPERQEC